MKLFRSLFLVLISLTSFLNAAESAKEADPQAPAPEAVPLKETTPAEAKAIKAFQAQMTEIKAEFSKLRQASMENEARSMKLSTQLSPKLAKVQTDGLPKDLADAFSNFKLYIQNDADMLKGIPEDEAKVMDWVAKKFEDEKFIAARERNSERQYEADSLLRTVGAPYGLTKEIDLYDSAELADDRPQDRWVVILGAYKNFPEAKTDALAAAKATKVPFSMNGMVFDKKGLHLPADSEDQAYAGEYLLRRFNETNIKDQVVPNHISVEKSEAYEGFEPGYYIVVGNIAETAEAAEKQLEKFKAVAKSTYVKKTKIYLGCLH